MFSETYQISRELTEKLLHELYHPCRDEIVQNNRALEKARSTMHITKTSNGATVEFDDLDLSFLDMPINAPNYLGVISSELVQIDWESDDSNTQFSLGYSSSLAA